MKMFTKMSNQASPMIRDFFGHKLGRGVQQSVGMLSPVRLHHNSQVGIQNTTQNMGVRGTMMNFAAAWKSGRSQGYGTKEFFEGRRIHFDPNRTEMNRIGAASTRMANIRMGVAGAIGAGGVSSFLAGNDNPVTNLTSFAGRAAGHTAIAAGIGKMNPFAGAAYAGASVVNSLRSGNQWGPF